MKKLIIVLTLFLGISGCATYNANYGENSKDLKTQEATFKADYETVYQTVIRTAVSMDWEVEHSEMEAGIVQFYVPGSLQRWEDNVSVTIVETDTGIKVTTHSQLANKPNRKEVGDFIARLKQNLN